MLISVLSMDPSNTFLQVEKQFLETGKKLYVGYTTREFASDGDMNLRKENQQLKEMVDDLMLRCDIVKKA